MTATRALVLRRGGSRDIDAFAALVAMSFDPRYGEGWTRSQCVGALALPGIRLTLAWRDDRPVGFALVRSVIDEAELLLLAVAPAERGRGIGGALLRCVIADAAAEGITDLHLEVRAGNDAVRLYRAQGFAKAGERRAYYRGPAGQAFDAHTYRRTLAG